MRLVGLSKDSWDKAKRPRGQDEAKRTKWRKDMQKHLRQLPVAESLELLNLRERDGRAARGNIQYNPRLRIVTASSLPHSLVHRLGIV